MCGACGSNRPVSALTAELNERKLKAPFAARLSSLIAPYSVRPFGDRWQLRSPTGRVELFEDVEELLAALGERGLIQDAALPAALVPNPGNVVEVP